MRILAGLVLVCILALTYPVRAQSECDAMKGRVITANGTISDLVYKPNRDVTQFFLRDSSLPCRGSILALVQGRTRCNDGMKVTIQGTWDQAETESGLKPYVILSDAEAVRCK
jgi:hypothetical protein